MMFVSGILALVSVALGILAVKVWHSLDHAPRPAAYTAPRYRLHLDMPLVSVVVASCNEAGAELDCVQSVLESNNSPSIGIEVSHCTAPMRM